MGFNILGIAINKKYASVQELATALDLGTLQNKGGHSFEEATSSQIDEADLYITELADGTLLTLGSGFDLDQIPLEMASANGKALRFMVGETAMVFALDYFVDGELVRSVINANGDNVSEEGEPLPAEEGESDMTEIIFNLIGHVNGVGFYSIEPGQPSVRYQQV